jgi:L-threonylcarbamoyladenylate synthase
MAFAVPEPPGPPALAGDLPSPAQLHQAVEVLLGGGLVAFPTETVYGLGADADQATAVASIFGAKGRPPAHPLIVHIARADAVASWASVIPEAAQVLMERFWPGPLTLILPRTARASDVVTGGQATVGLRCPAHPWAQALLQAFGAARGDPTVALAAPSANRYGRISATSAEHVRADLGLKPGGRLDLILDGGACTLGIESTIVDFAAGAARILRPGSIRAEQIRMALGEVLERATDQEAAPRTSGRVAGHYAPGKPLELVAMGALAARIGALGAPRLAVLAPPDARLGVADSALAMRLTASTEAEAYGRELYEHLHRFDAGHAQVLLVAQPPQGERWVAILDRLGRAAVGSAGPVPEAD